MTDTRAWESQSGYSGRRWAPESVTATVVTSSVYVSDGSAETLIRAIEDFRHLTKQQREFVIAAVSPSFASPGETTRATATDMEQGTSVESRIAERVHSFTRALYAADDEVRRYVSVDKEVMHGVPVVSGTRIPVYMIISLVEEGYSLVQILEMYSRLTEEQVKAALRYAGAVLEDRA